MRRATRWVSAWFLALCCSAISLPPQNTRQNPKEESRKRLTKPELESRGPEQPERTGPFTIGVSVDLVIVHTTVLDKSGHFVNGLKKESFRVTEDGAPQAVTYFSQEDVPVSLGIVIDTSGSMRGKIELVTKASLALIKASNPEDQVFLIGFNDQVELLEDFTNDIDAITDSLENTIVSGGTALYDAIYLAVQKAQKGIKPKKALVVISDGEDKDSYYKLEEMVSKVQESDVQVYCIGFLSEAPKKGLFGRWSKSIPEKAHDALERISTDTGARAYFPGKLTEIGTIVAEIAHELRNQYSIGYISSNTARDGTYRRLRVSLEPDAAAGAQVRYRRGYVAPKAPSQ